MLTELTDAVFDSALRTSAFIVAVLFILTIREFLFRRDELVERGSVDSTEPTYLTR